MTTVLFVINKRQIQCYLPDKHRCSYPMLIVLKPRMYEPDFERSNFKRSLKKLPIVYSATYLALDGCMMYLHISFQSASKLLVATFFDAPLDPLVDDVDQAVHREVRLQRVYSNDQSRKRDRQAILGHNKSIARTGTELPDPGHSKW